MNIKIKGMRVAISVLVLSILLSACGKTSKKDEVSTDTFVAEVKSKYSERNDFEYADAVTGVKRDHEIILETGFDKEEKGFKSFDQLYEVFVDAELRYPITTLNEYDKDKGEISIRPWKTPTYRLRDADRKVYLYDQGENMDWGNAQRYYLVQYVDLETGDELAKPIITVYDIENEIAGTPIVKYEVNEKGIATFSWNEIEGASEYAILRIRHSIPETDVDLESTEIIAQTKETTWSSEPEESFGTTRYNKEFQMFSMNSEDSMFEEYRKDETINKEEFLQSIKLIEDESQAEEEYFYTVIAMNKKGSSEVGNFIDARQVAKQTPIEIAYNLNYEGFTNSGFSANKHVNLLPSHTWITMGDGSATQKLINYDIEDVEKTRGSFLVSEENEDGTSSQKTKEIPVLSMKYTIEGTPFEGYVTIQDYNDKTYEKELKELKKRQDDLRERGGAIEKDADLNANEEVEENNDKVDTDVVASDDTIYASNALSEYLAINMLSGNKKINLDDFNESASQEYLLDAWYEAIYQNPLILGVRSIRMDNKNNVIISYDDDLDTMLKKQDEIRKKVDEIVKDIIKDGMSDYEIEEAINQYLCEHAEYDMDALDNAEQNNFQGVDPEFNDAFTAYGILINNKGVCAGYAGAFKLLADAAGIESIVVTGNLNGSLPHAWNRVKIDGEWFSLDVTNNDNEFISNALFNLPDSVSSKVLVEDKLYMVDSEISKYTAKVETNEYYRFKSKYFSINDITEQLVEGIENDSKAVLRTDYYITDDDFYEIANKVVEETGKELQGTYYLGVIYLEVK